MFSRHNRMIGVFYVLADAALALSSFWLAHVVRAHLRAARPLYPAVYYLWIVPVALGVWIGVGVATGIYREVREEDLRRAFAGPPNARFISTTSVFRPA